MAHPTHEYQHHPLSDPSHTRVFNLQPGEWADAIILDIEEVALDGEAEYEALSYEWGPQEPITGVMCGDDGQVMSIAPNLLAALRRLRRQDGARKLWVDKISIDQIDVGERSAQVNNMHRIFSSASQVLIWLGSEDEAARVAFTAIEKLYAEMSQHIRNEHDYVGAGQTDHPIQYAPADDSTWEAMRSLLKRPWFTRIWTFQEAVLARQLILISMAARPNLEDIRLRGAEEGPIRVYAARTMLSRFLGFSDGIQFLGLLDLLHALRNHQATDPRDKVFALLNVSIDARDSDLRADYSLSPVYVYARACKWLIRKYKSLKVLSLVEKKDKPDLVSWVPDFRAKDQWNFKHLPNIVYRGDSPFYRASGSALAICKDEPDLQLTVRAIYIGTIVDRSEPPGNLMGQVALGPGALDGGPWHNFVLSKLQGAAYGPTGENADLVFHRARIWD